MFFDLVIQSLEPSQIGASLSVALVSIVFRTVLARIVEAIVSVFLPAFFSFLANLAVLIFLFLLFLSAIFVLAVLPLP